MAFEFTDDAVRAVVAHMNGDHLDDQLAIVRAHGRPSAASARLITIGADGLAFDVQEGAGAEAVAGAITQRVTERITERITVPWPMPIEERADIRRAVVMLMPRPQRD